MADQLVDTQGLEKFLRQLGNCFRHPAQLYLVGGASLLLVGGKVSTFDIDFSTLEALFNELLPRYDNYGLKADPELYQRKFDLLRQRLQAAD